MWLELDFNCEASKFGLNNNLIADIAVEVDVICQDNYDISGESCDYQLTTLDFEVSFFGVKHDLLDTFSNGVDDIWDSLNESQKNLVNLWVKEKLKDQDTKEKIEDMYMDISIAHWESSQER